MEPNFEIALDRVINSLDTAPEGSEDTFMYWPTITMVLRFVSAEIRKDAKQTANRVRMIRKVQAAWTLDALLDSHFQGKTRQDVKAVLVKVKYLAG